MKIDHVLSISHFLFVYFVKSNFFKKSNVLKSFSFSKLPFDNIKLSKSKNMVTDSLKWKGKKKNGKFTKFWYHYKIQLFLKQNFRMMFVVHPYTPYFFHMMESLKVGTPLPKLPHFGSYKIIPFSSHSFEIEAYYRD